MFCSDQMFCAGSGGPKPSTDELFFHLLTMNHRSFSLLFDCVKALLGQCKTLLQNSVSSPLFERGWLFHLWHHKGLFPKTCVYNVRCSCCATNLPTESHLSYLVLSYISLSYLVLKKSGAERASFIATGQFTHPTEDCPKKVAFLIFLLSQSCFL